MINSTEDVDICPKRSPETTMKSIDVDAINCNGQTPLHLCIKNGYTDTFSLLLQLGCDIATLDGSEKIPFDREKELEICNKLTGMQKEKKAPFITKFERRAVNPSRAEVRETTVANSFEVLDDKNTIEEKENILSENRQIVIEINEDSGGIDNLSASETILDGARVVEEYNKRRTSNGQKINDKKLIEIEQDSWKSNLSKSLLENICPDDFKMASTCHVKEHWKELEYCSNPHQKLDFFQKGFRMNKGVLTESCNDGNHDLACTAGESCDINSSAYTFDINHNLLSNTDISSSCSTPNFVNCNSRMNETPDTSRCAKSKLKSKEDLDTRTQKIITKNCDLEAPLKLREKWKSISAPDIYNEADKSSDLTRKRDWYGVRSVDFSIDEIETFNIKGRIDSSCSSTYDSPASTVNTCNTNADSCEEIDTVLQEMEPLESQNQKATVMYKDNENHLELGQSITESNSNSNIVGTTINGDQPNDTCDVVNGPVQSAISQITCGSFASRMFTNEAKGNDEKKRSSKNNDSLLATDSSQNSYKGTDKFYVVDTAPVLVTTQETNIVGKNSFQLKLNGEQVETYDGIERSLCWKETNLEKYGQFNVHEPQITSKLQGTAFGGLNLCSDCLFKRNFKLANAEHIELNSGMGTTQSNSVSPVNELWEVWELNNNKNDCKKEWNSPNRTYTKRRQCLTTLPSRSRSLPDSMNTECNSLMEGILSDSIECFLTDSAGKSDMDALRRHSWPDLSAFPNFPFRSLSEQDLSASTSNGYNEQQVSFNTSIFNSVENRLGDGDSNQRHSEQIHSPESRSSSGSPPLLGSDPIIYSLNSPSPLLSPVRNKPELPYIFCENIYHIRSDSDLRGKYRDKYRLRAADDTALSRSTSYLSQCFLEEDIDYFPCKDDSHLHMNPKHHCYDWNLSIEPPCEYDKNNLTVSMKSKDEDCEHELAYSYICSENEDLDGSFICSDCGTKVPHIFVNKNEDQVDRGFVEVEKESKSKDEFVLICVPSRSEGCGEDKGNKNSGSLNFYHRDCQARSRRLSGVHGSLENIKEIDVEKDYEDFEQDDESLEYDDRKVNGKVNKDESKSFEKDGGCGDCVINTYYNDSRNDENNLPDKGGMNPCDKDGMNLRCKDGLNPCDEDGINLCGNDGMNLLDKDGINPIDKYSMNPSDNDIVNPSDKDGMNLFHKEGMNPYDKDGMSLSDKDGMNASDKDGMSLYDKEGMNLSDKDGMNLSDKDGMNLSDKDGMNASDKDGMSLYDKEGMNLSDKDAMNLSDKEGMNLSDKDGMNLSDKEGMNLSDKDAMNLSDKEGMNLSDKDGMNPYDKDGMNLSDKEGMNLFDKQGMNPYDIGEMNLRDTDSTSRRDKNSMNPCDNKEFDMDISEDISKRNGSKQLKYMNRQSSKCKLNFSNAECKSLEQELHDCSCFSKGLSYGCLRCSCERGISESTSESLISADTGIDMDDACLTDWEEFNQCLNFGSPTGDFFACSGKRRLSSTPVSRKASEDCIRREMKNRHGDQKQDADGDIGGQVLSKIQHDELNTENRNSRTSKQEETESADVRCQVDCDLAVASSFEVRGKGKTIDQEGGKENVKFKCVDQTNHSVSQREMLNERVSHRKWKVDEFGRGFLALLKKLARQAKHGSRKGLGGFDIKLIVNKNDHDLRVKVLVLNFENEEVLHSLTSTNSHKYDPTNANKVKLNSALELIIGSKKSKDSYGAVINCCNFYGKGRKVDINECWLVKSPKILAMIIVSIAESNEPMEFKVRVANALLYNVCSHSTCPLSSIINWVLVKLNFIKSESYVHASTSTSATLLLFAKMITEPYFKLESLRQLAYIIARPRIPKQNEETARKEFLCACLRIEINSFAFSCKYAFKIFLSVQMLLCGLEDELKTAFETLDKLLMKYLHEENCLDFVSDILIYLGLLKSEFQVNVTSDHKTCFQLLTHIVRQSYFPLNGVIVLDAFIKKPNQLLYSTELQKSAFELALQTRIKEEISVPAEAVYSISKDCLALEN